jgi:hypothetical protein
MPRGGGVPRGLPPAVSSRRDDSKGSPDEADGCLLLLAGAAFAAAPAMAAVYRCPDGSYQDKPCDKGGGRAVDTERGAVVRSPPAAAAASGMNCAQLARRRDEIVELQRLGASKAKMDKLERSRKDVARQMAVKKCGE